MIKELRVLNSKGIEAFRQGIRSNRADLRSYAKSISESPEYSSLVATLDNSLTAPSTRIEVGETLFPLIGPDGQYSYLADDPMFWAWISAAWMEDVLQPAEPVRSEERWIPDFTSRKYYRHLLQGPFVLYRAHAQDPSKIMVLLYQPISKPGEVVAQIHASNDLAFSSAAELANLLYFDQSTGAIKRGAGGNGEGSPRRLATSFLNQFKVNLDLAGMTAQALFEILPSEYDRFKR